MKSTHGRKPVYTVIVSADSGSISAVVVTVVDVGLDVTVNRSIVLRFAKAV